MTLSEYVISANKTSVPVHMDRWISLKQYYMSMHRFYMLKLHDYGYISNPTIFDQVEIRTVLNEYNITDFKDVCGNICLTSEFALFALWRAKGNNRDEEDLQFLDCLYHALLYKEYYMELDKQFEINNKQVKLRLGLTTCTNITSMTDVKLNRGVLMTLVDENTTLQEISFSEEMFKMGMEILGIPEKDFCDGMFISGLSLEEEMYFAKLILDGEVHTNGKYSDKLVSWLSEHKWSDGAYKNANSKGLYSYIHGTKDTEIYEIFKKYTAEYKDLFVAAVGDKIYLRKKIDKYKIPISPFCVVTSSLLEDEVICEQSSLYGYTGECYTYDYLEQEGYNCIGIPLRINYEGDEIEVYDVSQIVRPVNVNTWFSQSGVEFAFEDNTDDLAPNPYQEGTIQYELFEAYSKGMCGEIHTIPSTIGDLKEIKSKRKEVTKTIVKTINGGNT